MCINTYIYYNARTYIFVGYIAYLSAVRVDAAHNNPVINVFVYLLIEAKKAKKKSGIHGYVCVFMHCDGMCMFCVCAYVFM